MKAPEARFMATDRHDLHDDARLWPQPEPDSTDAAVASVNLYSNVQESRIFGKIIQRVGGTGVPPVSGATNHSRTPVPPKPLVASPRWVSSVFISG